MNKKTVSTILQMVVFLGLAAALIVWQMGRMDTREKEAMFTAIRSANLWYIFPVLVVGFLSHYFRALRWRLLMEPLGMKPGKANTFFAVMIGYLVNAILPRFGEVAKCTVLAKYEQVPADKMVGTIVSERAFDLVCLIIVILFAVGSQMGVIGGYGMDMLRELKNEKGHTLLYLSIALVVLLALMPMLYRRIKRTKIGHVIKGIGDGVQSIMHLRQRGLFLLYTVGIWASYLGMLILGFMCMPATQHLGALTGLTVLAFGSIGMIVTPGGIGAYPPLVGAILELYGISLPLGIAFGWVAWTAQTVVVILLGIVALILLPIYNRNRIPHAQTGMDTE